MTIDEAIRLLQKDLDDSGSVDIMDLNEAQQLGIEALKRLKVNRVKYAFPHSMLLPGETKD
ncbi:hypothetical protein ES708_23821 [subsurface metagenome]